MRSDMSDDLHIRMVLNGDESAYRYFITEYKDMAFTVAISIVKEENIAQEVVQDAFLKAFNSLNSFKREALFSTWFYRIVVNEALMRLKRMKREIITFSADYGEDVQDEDAFFSLEEPEQSHFINEALKKLSPNESLVLRLFYLQEENIRSVCDITGMSVSNVKVTLHRARKNMFRLISQLKKQNTIS
jgi:RNA polymerase sigma factor (sigma-70 family)